jgi:hypothetical protein
MKMVKSLLLGSAAGLVAVAGAQAADLPVKAKPVEYVKICSLYGDGFFYIPGTDTCLKIGGWVRWEMDVGAGGSHNPYIAGAGGIQDRGNTNDYQRVHGRQDPVVLRLLPRCVQLLRVPTIADTRSD